MYLQRGGQGTTMVVKGAKNGYVTGPPLQSSARWLPAPTSFKLVPRGPWALSPLHRLSDHPSKGWILSRFPILHQLLPVSVCTTHHALCRTELSGGRNTLPDVSLGQWNVNSSDRFPPGARAVKGCHVVSPALSLCHVPEKSRSSILGPRTRRLVGQGHGPQPVTRTRHKYLLSQPLASGECLLLLLHRELTDADGRTV